MAHGGSYEFSISGSRYLAPAGTEHVGTSQPLILSFSSHSRTVCLTWKHLGSGGNRLCWQAVVLSSVQSSTSEAELVCVFQLPESPKPHVTVEWIEHAIATYERDDDVFQKAFLRTVIFSGAKEGEVTLPPKAQDYLATVGNQRVIFLPCSSATILPGPYFLAGHQLRDVWKIVDDSHGTCMETLKPQSRYPASFLAFILPRKPD